MPRVILGFAALAGTMGLTISKPAAADYLMQISPTMKLTATGQVEIHHGSGIYQSIGPQGVSNGVELSPGSSSSLRVESNGRISHRGAYGDLTEMSPGYKSRNSESDQNKEDDTPKARSASKRAALPQADVSLAAPPPPPPKLLPNDAPTQLVYGPDGLGSMKGESYNGKPEIGIYYQKTKKLVDRLHIPEYPNTDAVSVIVDDDFEGRHLDYPRTSKTYTLRADGAVIDHRHVPLRKGAYASQAYPGLDQSGVSVPSGTEDAPSVNIQKISPKGEITSKDLPIQGNVVAGVCYPWNTSAKSAGENYGVIGTDAGMIYIVDNDGNLRSSYKAKAPIAYSGCFVDVTPNTFVFTDEKNNVYAMRTDGSIAGTAKFPEKILGIRNAWTKEDSTRIEIEYEHDKRGYFFWRKDDTEIKKTIIATPGVKAEPLGGDSSAHVEP